MVGETTENSYESLLNKYIGQKEIDKSFVDKVLNRKDSETLQKLMKKEHLNREDLLEILYLISGTNVKLVNYNDWDRYLLGKDFAWIRDFATLCESVIEWEKEITKEMENLTEEKKEPQITEEPKKLIKKRMDPSIIRELKDSDPTFEKIEKEETIEKTITEGSSKINLLKSKAELKELVIKIKALNLHNFKFLVDVYLNLSNSTLSLGAAGFDTLTKSRFEYYYPYQKEDNSSTPVKGSSLNIFSKRR